MIVVFMRKPLIIANWKANPTTVAEAVSLVKKIKGGLDKIRGVNIIIAPPFPFLLPISTMLKRAKLGAQDAFWADGPYTGEVSWRQLKSAGVQYVIVGHSERKINLGESDDLINKKVRALIEHGMNVILCVGECERIGKGMPPIVGIQLKEALKDVKKRQLKNIVVAYEPIWAISTQPHARPGTPDNAFRALVYIRKIIAGLYDSKAAGAVRVIYGGSVNDKNIISFLRDGKMEGALVGGASLRPEEFTNIIKNAAKVR